MSNILEFIYEELPESKGRIDDKISISPNEIVSLIRRYSESKKSAIPCVSGITEDFKHLKELVEGELITYSHFPPKDDIAQIHKESCEEALKKAEKYYR